MPKVKIGERRKTAMEKLEEVRQKQKRKKGKRESLTMKDLEERLEAVEQALEERH